VPNKTRHDLTAEEIVMGKYVRNKRGACSKGECQLDGILPGRREYAKRRGERLKDRIFHTIFPSLAQGFLEYRKHRLGSIETPTEEELADIFHATLTLLFRLLFLLHAESRGLLPVREALYRAASLKTIADEIAEKAGIAEREVSERLDKSYTTGETALYDRLSELFRAVDTGDSTPNIPAYRGGLFSAKTDRTDQREQRVVRLLRDHKVPDRFLALAIDGLARDHDERTSTLVFIDYKSLEVRHLGSIYEGLLAFKLKVANEDLTTQIDKRGKKYIALSQAKARRKQAAVEVKKRGLYLSNDKAVRKASGSYYTPDPIVQYIVAQAVGPVLEEKLEALRDDFIKVRKSFDRFKATAEANARKRITLDKNEFAHDAIHEKPKDLVELLFDFRVLDPAMGSGHFLVETVNFITNRLLKFLNQFPINPVSIVLARTRKTILESLGQQGVTVDAVRMSDANLLRNHVLNRCIYGVDLDSFAVELAKASLWLEYTTPGVPDNFLDHLRCGNSLIGATLSDLESVSPSLFASNYKSLMRAISPVLSFGKATSAAAAETASSSSRLDQARKRLAVYRLILGLLVAGHFGLPEAVELVKDCRNLDWTDMEQFIGSLQGEGERKLVAEAMELAQRPDRRFFHWEIEFPEAFFDLIDDSTLQIEHKDKLKKDSAGFNCVVGNPPYVRMELFKELKPFLRNGYRCHSDRADIFIYFHEKAIALLRAGGNYASICTSNWTKTTAGKNLRQLLTSVASITSIVDLSDANVFTDASTYPWIMVAKKAKHSARSSVFASSANGTLDSSHDLEKNSFTLRTGGLNSGPWLFARSTTSKLLDKLLTSGPFLKEVAGSPLYGIKTGLNRAFVIDLGTKDSFVKSDPKCAAILKPFLEGKDVRQWKTEPRNLWLIYATKGTEIEGYRSVHKHLLQFKDLLQERAANQEWYELQQAQLNYSKTFGLPKIVFPRFANWPCFALDAKGFFINNAISAIPSADPVLLFQLMSPVSWFIMRALGAPMANGYRQLHGHVIERIPVPAFSTSATATIKAWMEGKLKNKPETEPPWNLVYEALHISSEEKRIMLENQ
jgi:hypothetical protein